MVQPSCIPIKAVRPNNSEMQPNKSLVIPVVLSSAAQATWRRKEFRPFRPSSAAARQTLPRMPMAEAQGTWFFPRCFAWVLLYATVVVLGAIILKWEPSKQ